MFLTQFTGTWSIWSITGQIWSKGTKEQRSTTRAKFSASRIHPKNQLNRHLNIETENRLPISRFGANFGAEHESHYF